MLSVLITFTGTCNSGNTSWQSQTDSSLAIALCMKQLVQASASWFQWAQEQPGFSRHEPKTSAGVPTRLYGSMSMQSIAICSRRVEGYKFARDSLVLTRSDGKWASGCVNAFLSHAPAGHADCHVPLEAKKAEVGC